MKVSTVTISRFSHWYMLKNNLRSLVRLKPDECCILDTTVNDNKSAMFQDKVVRLCFELGLSIKLSRRPWDDNYANAKNVALGMCTGDWILILDSDEMLTNEMSNDLRKKLLSVPKYIKMLRPLPINILDDKTCIDGGIWENIKSRPYKGSHPHIFRNGIGHFERRIHEIFVYDGRDTILWDSPTHPLMDWVGYNYIHLWLYKDNPFRRWPDDINEVPALVKGDNVWRCNQDNLMGLRGWKRTNIPKRISYVPIIWKPLNLAILRKKRRGRTDKKHVPFNHRFRKEYDARQNN